ncbi:MAG: hypothetical protein ACFFG0_19005 [Candidatus Thorarchaeota archaeon]
MNRLDTLILNDFSVEKESLSSISSDRDSKIEERFISRFFINLIMPITKSNENFSPIKIDQTTLNKFFPELPNREEHSLIRKLKERKALSEGKDYNFWMKHDGTI